MVSNITVKKDDLTIEAVQSTKVELNSVNEGMVLLVDYRTQVIDLTI